VEDFLATLSGLIIDIDGTLWRGGEPLPGQREFFSFLTSRGIPFVVATNNTHAPEGYRKQFLSAGSDISPDHILTASEATAEYLLHHYPRESRVFAIGYGDLQKAIASRGFALVPDAGQGADVVVIGGDFKLTWEKLKDAILLVSRGADLIGSNPDMLIPTEEGLVPEAGTTLAAVEAATGRRPLIIGKPERHLFDLAVEKLGMEGRRQELAMIGDRVETDVVGAHAAGLRSILVCTGVDNLESARRIGVEPDAVFRDLQHLLGVWKEVLPKL
jgi:4-nitrophenyl phosphatase